MDFKDWIIVEEKHWMAINKPSGLIVEQNPFESPTIQELAVDYLAQSQANPYLGIVHRLDRVTSGVLLLAKRKSALRHLNELFAARSVQKVYWCLIAQAPPSSKGQLVHFLEKDQKNKIARIHATAGPGRQKVVLNYESLGQVSDFYLLEIRPETGRFHQIRAQLAAVACPIVGDEKYGSTFDPHHRHIALHARSLSFNAPGEGEQTTIIAPVPKEKWWADCT